MGDFVLGAGALLRRHFAELPTRLVRHGVRVGNASNGRPYRRPNSPTADTCSNASSSVVEDAGGKRRRLRRPNAAALVFSLGSWDY